MPTTCVLGIAGCLVACSPAPSGDSTPVHPPPAPQPVPVDSGDSATEPEPYWMDGFSFVDEHVAGMPQPGRTFPLTQDLLFLAEQQIALLVSLTEEPTDPVAVAEAGIDLLHLPIEDFQPPALDQQVAFVDEVIRRVAADQRVGVHDTAGLGRAGTMLATWFVAKGMDADAAIAAIRELRPGSIETDEQEQAVRDYDAAH